MQQLGRGVGGEKDSPTRMDKNKDRWRDTQTKILLYKPKGLCV
jgi:hypothetical protein